MTPGWTTATWLAVSISSMTAMRSKETTIPPSTGIDAPDNPVPEPRAVTGTPSSAATRTTAATSSVVAGRATARGRTGVRPSPSSWQRSSETAPPTSTWSGPQMAANRSVIIVHPLGTP